MKNFFQLDLKKILLPVIDDQTNVLIHGHFPRNWTIFHKEGLYVDSCGLNVNTYGWFLLLYDRKPQNSVKQFSFNSNVKKKKEEEEEGSFTRPQKGLWAFGIVSGFTVSTGHQLVGLQLGCVLGSVIPVKQQRLCFMTEQYYIYPFICRWALGCFHVLAIVNSVAT